MSDTPQPYTVNSEGVAVFIFDDSILYPKSTYPSPPFPFPSVVIRKSDGVVRTLHPSRGSVRLSDGAICLGYRKGIPRWVTPEYFAYDVKRLEYQRALVAHRNYACRHSVGAPEHAHIEPPPLPPRPTPPLMPPHFYEGFGKPPRVGSKARTPRKKSRLTLEDCPHLRKRKFAPRPNSRLRSLLPDLPDTKHYAPTSADMPLDLDSLVVIPNFSSYAINKDGDVVRVIAARRGYRAGQVNVRIAPNIHKKSHVWCHNLIDDNGKRHRIPTRFLMAQCHPDLTPPEDLMAYDAYQRKRNPQTLLERLREQELKYS